MFVQSILFAMLINSKEMGVNERRQWDYLGSILQYQNILGFIYIMQHLARSHCQSCFRYFGAGVLHHSDMHDVKDICFLYILYIHIFFIFSKLKS